MYSYIIIVLAMAMVLLPFIVDRTVRIYRHRQYVNNFLSKQFACPNCGYKFHATNRMVFPINDNKAYVKCPHCKKRDVCTRPFNSNDN